MSDYHLVTTLHAARVTLADARKAGNAAAVAAAEAQVAATRAAVDAALADGRVVSAAHLLDLDLDCLGAILSRVGPRDALSTARTCTTLRSALFCGGLPWPLAGFCRKSWNMETAAIKEAALRALEAMEPALGAQRLEFFFSRFDETDARLLVRALDALPRVAQIDISITNCHSFQEDDARRLADVLSSRRRAFAAPPQVHLFDVDDVDDPVMRLLASAGVCVASVEQWSLSGDPHFIGMIAANVANTLTRVDICPYGAVNLMTRFPALRQLNMGIRDLDCHTTVTPSLTALAPHLKEIKFECVLDGVPEGPQKHGFGFEPRRFARFLAAIQGVTRVSFGPEMAFTLSQNENENLGQLTVLHTLRDLEISCDASFAELVPLPSSPGQFRAPVAEDAITNLPPLPLGLTRLAFSGATRVAFGHPLPELRVLDWRGGGFERGSMNKVLCHWFRWDEGNVQQPYQLVWEGDLVVPLAVPSAAIAPNLHTLLIGYGLRLFQSSRGDFDLWTLVAARTALRIVVIEHARLLCSAPAGFDTTTTAGFAAVLAREANGLVSVHAHGCEIAADHQVAVENFSRAFEERGGRVCRAGVKECLFCMLHDGKDVWTPE